MRNRRLELAVALGLGATVLAGVTGCGNRGGGEAKAGAAPAAGQAQAAATPNVVRVAPAKLDTVTRTLAVTGSVRALESVNLSPKISARVVSVSGREGARVSRGQAVVQQDTSDLERQAEQRQADVRTAQARLAQAETNLRLQGTTNRTGVQNAEAALRSARAGLRSAQQALAVARQPQRSQEIAVAENTVRQRQAEYDRAKKDRERYQQLVDQGAAAQITLDQYVTNEKVAEENVNSAKQQLEIAREGGRAEEVRQAQAQVTQRQQDVVQAESNLRQARANTQQLEVRQDEVRAARATVEQARAALAVARQAIADATIRSPIDGLISTRGTEPGQQAAPGSTVATIVALDTVYFEAKVPDTDIAALAAGQSVGVTIDAFPGRKFQGRIARIEPAGDNASRTFNVRVEIPNSGAALRPGLFARGEVVAERRQNVVTVPTEALLRPTGGETGAAAEQIRIFTVQDGVAREAKVETGLSSPDGLRVEVTGVPANSQVVVSGQRGIKDGDKVTAEPVNGAGASGAGAQQTASR